MFAQHPFFGPLADNSKQQTLATCRTTQDPVTGVANTHANAILVTHNSFSMYQVRRLAATYGIAACLLCLMQTPAQANKLDAVAQRLGNACKLRVTDQFNVSMSEARVSLGATLKSVQKNHLAGRVFPSCERISC